MPPSLSPLRGLDPNYVTQATGYGLALPRFAEHLTYMLRRRNDFSARFLRRALGRGVRVLQGLVVLAGDHHTLGDQCDGAEGAIQHFLGISEDRVVHLS
ncbi:MAG: hypothetical protein KF850_19090 [Labilithrix sp.]|nr:hypothetical protein [Labilithrix sp.]MBX3214148.1 hypothetical protein [Labilithrix sp.]